MPMLNPTEMLSIEQGDGKKCRFIPGKKLCFLLIDFPGKGFGGERAFRTMKGRQGVVNFIKGKKQQDSKGKTGF